MVHALAAAGLELCVPAACRRARPLLGRKETRAPEERPSDAAAQVRADRNAEKHPHRLRQRLFRRGHRLCPDLAHLVDGRFRNPRRIRDSAGVRIPRRRRGRDTGRDDCSIRSRAPDGGRPMNDAVAIYDVSQEAFVPASEAGPAPKRIVVAYGFWVFLLSDIIMFSALFAAYAVL